LEIIVPKLEIIVPKEDEQIIYEKLWFAHPDNKLPKT